MKIDEKLLGEAVKSFRTARNMTQEELAQKLDVSTNFLSQLETGRRGISTPKLNELAGILGVPAAVITLMGTAPPEKNDAAGRLLEKLQKLARTTLEASSQPKAERRSKA